jgi:hypothetical protein
MSTQKYQFALYCDKMVWYRDVRIGKRDLPWWVDVAESKALQTGQPSPLRQPK